MTTETETRLEALERLVGAGRLAEIAIADERAAIEREQRAARIAEASAETAGIAWERNRIAGRWLEQLPRVRTALEAFMAANDELARLAGEDDDAWREQRRIANSTGCSPNADPRCLTSLDLPSLPATLERQLDMIEAQAERFGVRERAADPATS